MTGPDPEREGAQHVEPRSYLGCDLDVVEIALVAVGSVAVFARRSPTKETVNEDSVLVADFAPDRTVLAVADGIGGHAAGERASRQAVESLVEGLDAALARGAGLRDGVLDGFDAAEKAITALGIGAGTTLCVVVLERDPDRGTIQVRTYNVGDSAALLCGQRGLLKHVTVMHSPVGYAVESGMLGEDEAILHDERHLVSNAIGAGDMKIEIGPILEMAARDTLVVATDGLWDNLRNEEVVEVVRRGPLRKAAESLRARARERMLGDEPGQPAKPDDLGFVVFRRS